MSEFPTLFESAMDKIGWSVPIIIFVIIMRYLNSKNTNTNAIIKNLLDKPITLSKRKRRIKFILRFYFVLVPFLLDLVFITSINPDNPLFQDSIINYIVVIIALVLLIIFGVLIARIFIFGQSYLKNKVPVCQDKFNRRKFIVLRILHSKMLVLPMYYYENSHRKCNVINNKLLSAKGKCYIDNVYCLNHCSILYVKNCIK